MRTFMIITSTFVFACAAKHEVHRESSTGQRASSAESASRVASPSPLKAEAGAAVDYHHCLPEMGVHVGIHQGKPVFRVDFNCGESPEVYVDDIVVTDPGYRGWNTRIYCHLRGGNGSNAVNTAFTSSGWEYGGPLAGYAVTGSCAPLQQGRKYEVGVTGAGVGFSIFSIERDGNIRVHQESCQKPPTQKNVAPAGAR